MCTLKFHAVRLRLTYFAHGLLLRIVQQVRWYASEKSIKVLTCLTLLGLKLGFSIFPEYLACRYLEVTESVCVCAMLWHQTCVCDEYYLPLSLYLSSSLASFICWTMPCLGALSLYSLSAPPFIWRVQEAPTIWSFVQCGGGLHCLEIWLAFAACVWLSKVLHQSTEFFELSVVQYFVELNYCWGFCRVELCSISSFYFLVLCAIPHCERFLLERTQLICEHLLSEVGVGPTSFVLRALLSFVWNFVPFCCWELCSLPFWALH